MLSVVLPLYNEEDNIAKVIRTAAEFLRTLKIHFEIIAVDDGSRDRSGEILKKLGLEFPELIVVSHNQNLGYGAALRSGFSQARGELIFFTDSDLQIKIEELGNFLKNIDSYDFVVGYRMNRQDPWHRRLFSMFFNLLGRFLFKIRVRDLNCAAKLFRAEMIKSLPLSSNGFLVNLEIFALAQKRGFKFLELPVTHFPRLKGKPLSSFRQVFRSLTGLFKLWSRLN
ncbi:hypothetical protein A2757_00705 [Candidatus Giovannonibacteria bacterium RIFCSPHIGHO2_01_FULL_48_47]|nr:MAG: hypothetical protein A2757_00705 [Candidatus Giovannonibacteria bacterium RIFCSPHIGHO2_01_FULL_48_47]OGF68343.1 MAG: hypothetical protein A3D61_00470 [Candidatus Giovannonibacteria bacterium RIFCSPHIGHO2_02_FULL_48_15]OGF87990.1 MAG: hypothetical protein A3B26_03815 [Candidatus Giovannonibacteria bacterium RIFCSPLOWO2_01_FULL_48_47]OGF95520.1 MAG: hypothetical protein A2433_02190 [Candidatus Giovannonibacteria bacterium RIFOXYC1_FULL_48_8]OGF96203.1 MAG: hypothetical protein A2613_01380